MKSCFLGTSVELDAHLLDDRAPFLEIALGERRQRLGPLRDHLDPEVLEPLSYLRNREHGADLSVEPGDDVGRGAGRRVDAEPRPAS